jgi:hypothetical protein
VTALLALVLAANPSLSQPLAHDFAAHMMVLDKQVPPRIMEALVFEESRWHPTCRGTHGEVGLCQIMPLHHPPRGWTKQMDWAARFLSGQRHESMRLKLADYNGGPGGHRKQRCLRYADRILRRARR